MVKPQFDAAREYAEGLAAVMVNEKWGYINETGAYIANPQYDDVDAFCEGLAAVRVGDRIGYIGHDGAYVITPQFESATRFYNGLAAVSLGGKGGIINKDGRQIVGELVPSAAQEQAQPPVEQQPQAAKQQPTQSSAQIAAEHVAKAKGLFEQSNYDAAQAECEAALAADPQNKDALDLRAQIAQTKKILGIQ